MIKRENIISFAQKPQQYLGNEINAVKKDFKKIKLKIALLFPDLYEIGMSNYGLKILYELINRNKKLAAERVFLPGKDVEEFLIKEKEELFSLESFEPVKNFDILGITLSSELLYTNILHTLFLSNIPYETKDRNKGFPLITAGGIGAFNPEPLAEFIDIFYIGDGEEIFPTILDEIAVEGLDPKNQKIQVLQIFNKYKNIYIPSLNKNPFYINRANSSYYQFEYFSDEKSKKDKKVYKGQIKKLKEKFIPVKPVVPYINIVQDRAQIEAARGCKRGCRFCIAGYVYRPYRELDKKIIIQKSDEIIKNTGYNEFNISSLSISDYKNIKSVLININKKLGSKGISITVPSLRINTFDKDDFKNLHHVKRSGLTFAVESGSQSGRDIINKKINEKEIFKTIENVVENNWQLIKLYFMIGLPFCEDEDKSIIDLVEKIARGFPRLKINLNIGTFVPKPHTPFQWCSIINLKKAESLMANIKIGLKKFRRVLIRYQEPAMSYVEAYISKGSRSISETILNAYLKGAKFDAWEEKFQKEIWLELISKTEFPKYIMKDPDVNNNHPWDFLIKGENLLKKEFQKAIVAANTKKYSENFIYKPKSKKQNTSIVKKERSKKLIFNKDIPTKNYIQIYFQKLGLSKYISHRDTMEYFEKIFRMINFPITYTKGFSPHPKISIPYPIPLYIESPKELLITEVHSDLNIYKIINSFNKISKNGIKILNIVITDIKKLNKIKHINYLFKFDKEKNRKQLKDKYFAKDLEKKIRSAEILIPDKDKKKLIKPNKDIRKITFTNDQFSILFNENVSIKLYIEFLKIKNYRKICRKISFITAKK